MPVATARTTTINDTYLVQLSRFSFSLPERRSSAIERISSWMSFSWLVGLIGSVSGFPSVGRPWSRSSSEAGDSIL